MNIFMNRQKSNLNSFANLSLTKEHFLFDMNPQLLVCVLSILHFRPSERFREPTEETLKWTRCSPLPFRSRLTTKPIVCLCKNGESRTQKCTLASEIEKRCPNNYDGKH